MWRLAKAMTITFIFAVAFVTASAAEAGRGCRYSIFVSREEIPGARSARLCDVGGVVDWLRAVPEAEVLLQAPHGALKDGFTVSVFLTRGFLYEPNPLPIPPRRGQLLTERVYPVAESGPVAFVPSRTVFHGPGGYPRWVVRAGWRSIDANKPVPRVLTKLGMLQPEVGSTIPTLAPRSATPPTNSSRPGPDVVTLSFLLAILVSVAVVVRRNRGGTSEASDALSGHSEAPHHG